MTAGTVVITGGILATVILLCIIAVLCYCRLQVCLCVCVSECLSSCLSVCVKIKINHCLLLYVPLKLIVFLILHSVVSFVSPLANKVTNIL